MSKQLRDWAVKWLLWRFWYEKVGLLEVVLLLVVVGPELSLFA